MGTTKMQLGDITTKKFTDSAGTEFKLPKGVVKCPDANSTTCGVNVQVKQWDPRVHGMEVILPSSNASTSNSSLAQDIGELGSQVTSLTMRKDSDDAEEEEVKDLPDTDEDAIVFEMKLAPLSDAKKRLIEAGNYSEEDPMCGWVNKTSQEFSTEGCTRVSIRLDEDNVTKI